MNHDARRDSLRLCTKKKTMMNNKFLGLNGFLWFVGVVEDRMDPTYTGRVRVRALGHHTQNKLLILPFRMLGM